MIIRFFKIFSVIAVAGVVAPASLSAAPLDPIGNVEEVAILAPGTPLGSRQSVDYRTCNLEEQEKRYTYNPDEKEFPCKAVKRSKLDVLGEGKAERTAAGGAGPITSVSVHKEGKPSGGRGMDGIRSDTLSRNGWSFFASVDHGSDDSGSDGGGSDDGGSDGGGSDDGGSDGGGSDDGGSDDGGSGGGSDDGGSNDDDDGDDDDGGDD